MGIGKSSSPPPSPDYQGAAQATAQGNLQAAREATEANRVNYNTPYGSLAYSQDPSNPNRWTANVTLSPEQQQLLNQQNQTSLNLGNLQNSATGRVQQTLGSGFDTSTLPNAPVNAGTTGQQAIMNRLQPQFDRSEEQLRTRLANQGIMQGSEAYNAEMNNFNQGKNDAYSQAALQGINLDTSARQNAFGEQSYLRSLPLNELNAIRTGSQVTSPTFGSVPQQQATTGANLLGAAQAQGQYDMNSANARSASNNAMMGGLFQLGGAAMNYFSDRRLKTDIEKIGTRPDGLNVYSYTYVWGEPAIGVMADEVKRVYPHAVTRHESGFDMVNYGALQ